MKKARGISQEPIPTHSTEHEVNGYERVDEQSQKDPEMDDEIYGPGLPGSRTELYAIGSAMQRRNLLAAEKKYSPKKR